MRADDLAPLIQPPPSAGLGFRQGRVLAWDPETAHNTIEVAGTVMQDIPILNGAEALLLGVGDIVGLITHGSTWFILGRVTVPGSPEAARTLGAGMKAASVIGNTPISNTAGYELNGGPVVTTQVLPTGRVFVLFASGWDLDVGEGVSLNVFGFGPSGQVRWANTDLSGWCLITGTGLGGSLAVGGATGELMTDLEPGEWRFELRSVKDHGSGNPGVYNRVLTVMPI
jgi:hypothetical protein